MSVHDKYRESKSGNYFCINFDTFYENITVDNFELSPVEFKTDKWACWRKIVDADYDDE